MKSNVQTKKMNKKMKYTFTFAFVNKTVAM